MDTRRKRSYYEAATTTATAQEHTSYNTDQAAGGGATIDDTSLITAVSKLLPISTNSANKICSAIMEEDIRRLREENMSLARAVVLEEMSNFTLTRGATNSSKATHYAGDIQQLYYF
jgi:hypothetical protein